MTKASQSANDNGAAPYSGDPSLLYRILRSERLLPAVVFPFLMAGVLSVAVGAALGLANFRDVGYPDSAALLRIKGIALTGKIYPALDQPPYLVTIYGPAMYCLLGVPYQLASMIGIDHQVAVRVAVVLSLLLCVFLLSLISRRLHSSPSEMGICAVFALSLFPLAPWVTQIRGDFPALVFSLLAIYLIFRANGDWRRALVAGASAGAALLVKQTFISAPVAVLGWLLYRRRFREAAFWILGLLASLVAGYGIEYWREPQMLEHLAALRDPILDFTGALAILNGSLTQPLVAFAAVGVFVALQSRSDESKLLVAYWSLAWLVAALAVLQIGANTNYFWEPLLVSAVFAARGFSVIQHNLRRAPLPVTVMFLVILLRSFSAGLRNEATYYSDAYRTLTVHQSRKARWNALVSVVSGRRLLSTLPDVSALSSIPEIPDPFVYRVFHGGHWDSSRFVAQIEAGVYDVIVTGQDESKPGAGGHRGVPRWDSAMWTALRGAYTSECVYEGMEVWLPRLGSGELPRRLSDIGCRIPALSSVVPAAMDSESGSRIY